MTTKSVTVMINTVSTVTLSCSKLICLLYFILLIASSPAHAQVCAAPGKDGSPGTITGVVNAYYPGTASVAANATSITLGAATGASKTITSGDLLLVIQMQDASINSSNNSRYGDGVNGGAGSGYTAANGVGRYEFVTATNGVLTSGGTLTLQGAGGGGGLINAYTNANATGTQGQRRFQVVRVPQYFSATLSSGLTALAWNGSTGGILALDVAGTVSLNNSTVSVAGLGFRGGAGLRLQGSGGVNTDYLNTAPSSAATLTGFHGSKGEGIAGTPRYVWNAATGAVVDTGVEGYPNGSMARGAPGNAGGGSTDGDPNGASPGGNDQNSGGGGGGNGGAGGVGGNTWSSNLARGGAGGVAFAERAAGRVVMGGGGGAGTRNNDTNVAASGAAAGGGIVIIRAGTVTGTGFINASGAAAYNETLNDGGGGGGAGGSVIVLALSGNLSGLTVNASGGRGGDAWHSQAPGGTPGDRHGPGGGGGGGVIFLSSAAASLSVAGGANGVTTTALDAYSATAGAVGSTSTSMTTSQIPGTQPGALCPVLPTACKLESFNASRSDNGVVLEWHTGYEVDNIGFNVYRENEVGKPVRLTPHLVAGSALMVHRGTLLTAGLAYSWSDPETKAGDSPRYWLEDIDISGRSTWSGPFWIDENRKPARSLSPVASRSVMINAVNAQQLAAAGQDSQYQPVGPVEVKAKTVKLAGAGLLQQVNLAGQPAVKISVRQEGYYRVNQPDLLAAGLDSKADPRKLQLYVDGQQIPMIVQGEKDGVFDPQDSIEFYGLGLDTASTDTHVYWLIAGQQPGIRIKSFKGAAGAGVSDSFQYTVQRKDRLYYFSNIPNGDRENFFGAFIYYQPTDQTMAANHIAPAANASLEIAMQGFNIGKHQIAVSVNGALVGTLSFLDQAYSVTTLTFAQSLLTEGTNTITMVAQAGNSDFSFVDYMRLTYLHSYNADNNALKFTSAPSHSVTVNGLNDPAIRVMDVTDPASPQEMLGRVSQTPQGYAVTTGTTGGAATRTLMVFVDSQAKQAAKVAANKVSSWRQPSNSADLLIVGYADFLPSFDALKALRQQQGLVTQSVDIEDVYDEFNGGNKSPQALKDFLSYAKANWTKAPRYVLLGGTASFDPRNYLGVGATDFVPTMFVQTAHIETASDDTLADFNNDGIPEIAVGRLPARTIDEANRMVQKVIDYDQNVASGTGVLLVADVNNGFDFEANNDQLKQLVPSGYPVLDIRRGSDPQAHQDLLDALNLGKKLVNYTGHGSVDLWEANLLTDADAATLVNAQKLSVVVAMTCLNGYFIDERIESLAHALLNSRNGGAVAMWSSSGLTAPDAQATADFELFRQLFAGASIRLGDATIRAKTAISDIDVRRTWILIGDPTTRFRQ